MKKQVLLLLALLIMLFDSGCVMRNVHGTPYRIGTGRRTSRHWGTGRHYSSRQNFWGRHRYGKRPNQYRGRYR